MSEEIRRKGEGWEIQDGDQVSKVINVCTCRRLSLGEEIPWNSAAGAAGAPSVILVGGGRDKNNGMLLSPT